MFCPKCGALLLPRPGRKDLECSCGYKQHSDGVLFREKGIESSRVEVIEKEESVNIIVDAECPKCGPVKAEHWEIQTRAADEPATRFFKCKNCGHTWREYK